MIVYSAARPTGNLHIGNYLGAIKTWTELQGKNECFFSIADLHAITTPYDAKKLKEMTLDLAKLYLASGIDPKKCCFFIQSQVKEHAELAWLLETITPIGELQRMTQFKDKSQENKNYINAGLLNYPVLMAADILLYQAQIVPVGMDQKQHIELTRNIAERFNNKFGKTFTVPEPNFKKEGIKIMSLTNPKKKMSKTGDQKGCINLSDSKEEIKKKIMSATTDSGKEIKFDIKNKPGISNLITIYSLYSNKSINDAEKEFKNKNYADFKKAVSDLIIEKIGIIQENKNKLSDKETIKILEKGAEEAQKTAQHTMKVVKKNMGII